VKQKVGASMYPFTRQRRAPVPLSGPVSAQVTRQLSSPSVLWNWSGRLPFMEIVKSPCISL
jgi:hypothetical protein